MIKDNSKENQLVNSDMGLDLQRAMFEMTERNISVKFIKDFPSFNFGGISIPSASENSRLDLPYYIAEILYQEGIIEDFKTSFPISLQEMTTAVRKEVRQGEVQPLHPFFHMVYKKIALEESVDSSPYTEKEFKLKKAKLTQITSERLAKLIKMADSPKINVKKTNLTASEQILMEKIHRWIVNWKELIITSKWGQTE